MSTPRLSKRLGQHLLVDDRHARRLVALVQCEPEALCLEVGPGQGALTELLAPKVARLIAVELDARWIPALRARCAPFSHVAIVHADILQFAPPVERPLVVVGAIPYQITSPLIERLIAWKPRLTRAYLVIQREVAQRITAHPGTTAWGRLSCLTQYHFQATLRWGIPPSAFRPAPRVRSSVIELVSRATPPCHVRDETFFFAFIAQLFQSRRKTLWNTVRMWQGLALSEHDLRAVFAELELVPAIRGETLSLAALARLANRLCPST